MDGYTGYAEAKQATSVGRARAHALWVVLTDEHQRDGYALRAMPWEGPGEYQHVDHNDGRNGLVRIPEARSLPVHHHL